MMKGIYLIKFVFIYTRAAKVVVVQLAQLKLLVHLMMINGFAKITIWNLKIISEKFYQVNL